MENPLLSISCITYNQEKYIRECLDGFLMQKADFSFEILIHDDASTDDTAKIIQEYEAKYPDLIKPIYQLENQYSKGQRGISIKYNFPRAKGKYIAMCEGDDSWTDPLKLQKQVDFLDKNAGFVLCGSDVTMKHSDNEISYDNSKLFGEIVLKDVLRKNPFSTCSVVFKKDVLDSSFFRKRNDIFTGDWFLWSILMKNGKGFNFRDNTAIYNIHLGGIVSGRSKSQTLKNKLNDRIIMMEMFPENKAHIKSYGIRIIMHYFKRSFKDKNYFQAFFKNKKIIWKYLNF